MCIRDRSSAVEFCGIVFSSPLGVNTNISEANKFSLIVSKTSMASGCGSSNISDVYKRQDGTLSIVGLKGTSDGWIKIVGDVPVHGGITKEAALILDDCQYLIFEKLLVSGGFRHGIKTNAKVENVRFVNCEVTQWGRESIRQNQDGHYLDRNGKMINNDGGITAVSYTHLQRCLLMILLGNILQYRLIGKRRALRRHNMVLIL